MKNFNFNNETEFVFSDEFIGFTTIPNYILNDNRLSYKALGLYCQILQFQNSPTHSLYQKTLVQLKKDGRTSISAGVSELIKCGYLKKEQLKDENGFYCGIKYTVFMKPIIKKENDEIPVNINVLSESGKSDFGYSDIPKPTTKKKINKKENIKKENISLSKENDFDDQLKKYLDKYNKIKNETFKIEIEDNNNELNNIIVNIANNILSNNENVIINNKEININDIIQQLKELTKQNINKLVNYVARKFENANTSNIINKSKYISTIFINAIFEKTYLLDNDKNTQINYNYNKPKTTNKFINFDQPKVDFKKLRELELQSLKETKDISLITDKYKDLIPN